MYEPAVYESLDHAPAGSYYRVRGGWAATPVPEPVEGRKRYQPHDVDPSLFGPQAATRDAADHAEDSEPDGPDSEAEDDTDTSRSTGVDGGSTVPPAS
jgi:hypothetical protein